MNNNVVLHLTKHCISLKKSNYLMVLSAISAIAALRIFMMFYNVSEELVMLAQGLTIVFSFFVLFQSFLIPAQGKISSKKQGSNYSWSYVFSSVRFAKSFLIAVAVEYSIDSFFFACVTSIAIARSKFEFLGGFFATFLLSLLVLHLIRFFLIGVGIQNTKGRTGIEKKDNTRFRKYLIIIGLLGVVLFKFNSLNIPTDLFLYVILSCGVLLVVIHPFVIYSSFVKDPNKKESKILNLRYTAAFSFMAILGATYFYFDQVKDGYQIFTAIRDNEVQKVKEMILKDKNLLKMHSKMTNLTPLFSATKANYTELVKVILSNGGNVNELDSIGNNLLTYTASNCNLALSELLVEQGINFNQMPSDNENPLFTAASKNCLPLIMYFRKLKMNEIQKNAKGQDYIQYGLSKSANFNSSYKFLLKNNLW